MIFKTQKNPRLTKKDTLSTEIKKGYLYLIITIILLNAIFGGLLLTIGSQMNAKGYILVELQRQAEDLKAANKLLDQKITEAQTFSTLQEKTKEMTSPSIEKGKEGEVTYLKKTDSASLPK